MFDRCDHTMHGINSPVLALVEPLAFPGFAGPHRGNQFLKDIVPRLRDSKFLPAASDQFVARISNLFTEAAIGEVDPAVEVDDDNRRMTLLHGLGQISNYITLLGLAARHVPGEEWQPERNPDEER